MNVSFRMYKYCYSNLGTIASSKVGYFFSPCMHRRKGFPKKKFSKRAESRYFELFWPGTKLLLNLKKPENTLLR